MMKIGFVGVGAISGIYLENLTKLFKEVEIVGVCDLVREKAEKAKADYQIPKIYDTMYDLFADDEVDIVLNITRPYEHYEVTKAALLAGKHVYTEKPLAATFEEGKELVALAQEKGLMLGGAPDTFMGAGIQTCRRLIDSGFIGQPVGAHASLQCHGHESWHPDPAFYYQHGGGPMMDMGPYYITALVNLLGEARTVTGLTQTSFPTRTITSQPLFGTVVDVETPTHINGIVQFASGAAATVTTSFDVYPKESIRFEVYGTEGTLAVPDPNCFGGPVLLFRPEQGEFKEIPLLFDYRENSRGLGLADMARAIETGRDYRASCQQIYHVLEILTAFEKSSKAKQAVELTTHYSQKAPMVLTGKHGVLD